MKRISWASLLLGLALMPSEIKAEEKFEAHPIGVLHMDAATYFGNMRDEFATGVALPEIRLGADGKYGAWKFRILVGFAENKVKARDIYLQYNLDEHNYIRGGHFVHQYGYQNSSAAFEKPTMVGASCETAFNLPQRVGIAYVHCGPQAMVSTSIYTPDDVIANLFGQTAGKVRKQSFGMKCRTAWHPYTDANELIGQVGFSALFETPHSTYTDNDGDYNKYFSFTIPFPTKVHNVTALSEEVEDARNRWEVTPDLLLAHKRMAFETQYYYTRVNRLYDQNFFRGQGFYVNLRGILIGDNYSFSNGVAGLNVPRPKSLEGILTFDYTDMGYHKIGGSQKILETAAVFNYFINKYMTVRLRGGWTHLPSSNYENLDGAVASSKSLFTLQTRFQLIF